MAKQLPAKVRVTCRDNPAWAGAVYTKAIPLAQLAGYVEIMQAFGWAIEIEETSAF